MNVSSNPDPATIPDPTSLGATYLEATLIASSTAAQPKRMTRVPAGPTCPRAPGCAAFGRSLFFLLSCSGRVVCGGKETVLGHVGGRRRVLGSRPLFLHLHRGRRTGD